MSLVPALAEQQAAHIERRRRMGMVKPVVVSLEAVGRPMPVEPSPAAKPVAPTNPAKPAAPISTTARQILAETCERHGLKVACVVGPRRYKPLVDCRQEAAWLIAKNTALSYPQIARLLGKDHTTILFAVRRHNEFMGENVRNCGGVPEKTRERNRLSARNRKAKTRAMRLRISEMKRNREDFRL